MREVSVVVVRSPELLSRCKVSTTAAPTPGISILDGAGKNISHVATMMVCRAGKVRIQCGAFVDLHLVGVVVHCRRRLREEIG